MHLIRGFHIILTHPDCKRSRMTIQARCYHPDIKKYDDNFRCDYSQCLKIPCKGMGLSRECNLTNTPWYDVIIDLIGLWSAKTEHCIGEFNALTFINTTTNLVELINIDTKSRDVIARKFENTWFTCYPRLAQVVHDNGVKCTAKAFAHLLYVFWKSRIFSQPTKIYMQTYASVYDNCVEDIALTTASTNTTRRLASCNDGLATKMWLMRSTISMILKASLGALAFSLGMFLNIPLIVE